MTHHAWQLFSELAVTDAVSYQTPAKKKPVKSGVLKHILTTRQETYKSLPCLASTADTVGSTLADMDAYSASNESRTRCKQRTDYYQHVKVWAKKSLL